jgi:hypothetical protein
MYAHWYRSSSCFRACAALCLLVPAAGLLAQSGLDPFGSRRRATGAPVAPVFEGWEPNRDGTFNLYFGYQNRNWQEEVDIPVGDSNFFSPGPLDRGQPTHFLVNRRKLVFSVVVPKDFGTQTLMWTLTSHGSTEAVPGKLSPILQIDTTKDEKNVAPTLGLGPEQTIVFPRAATLDATVTSGRDKTASQDTGRTTPAGRPSRLTIAWTKYRGPGAVTFADATPPVKNGHAVTTATFSEPGVYVLHALADEGSRGDATQSGGIPGFLCCWTNAQLTIVVKPSDQGGVR